jgi:hypothetical protein
VVVVVVAVAFVVVCVVAEVVAVVVGVAVVVVVVVVVVVGVVVGVRSRMRNAATRSHFGPHECDSKAKNASKLSRDNILRAATAAAGRERQPHDNQHEATARCRCELPRHEATSGSMHATSKINLIKAEHRQRTVHMMLLLKTVVLSPSLRMSLLRPRIILILEYHCSCYYYSYCCCCC